MPPTQDNSKFDLAKLADLIQRVNGHRFDEQRLVEDLDNLLHLTGNKFDASEEARIWQEFCEEESKHSAGDIAKTLLKLANAANLLDHECISKEVLPELTIKLRRHVERFSSKNTAQVVQRPRALDWDSLSEAEKSKVRELTKDLAQYYQAQVSRGAPRKDRFDTLLIEVAGIWIDQTGQSGSVYEVPYNVKSRFTQFAEAVLMPFGHGTEISRKALSRRWERIVLDCRESEPDCSDCGY